MDFVVFGFGLGAVLMLVGFALRDLGPWLFGSTRDEQALPEFEGAKSTIRKQTLSSIGNAISVGGAGIAVVTFSALLAKTDDDLGAIVVAMSLVLATLGVVAWSYDVFRRHRMAMDIISAQEHAVRGRMVPNGKRRRPRPAASPSLAEQPAVPADPAPAAATETPLAADPAGDDEPERAESLAEETSDDAVPLVTVPDDDVEEATTLSQEVAADREADLADDATKSEQGQSISPSQEPESVIVPETTAADREGASEPEPNRRRELDPVRRPERIELPPLPVEPDDALIDESVRLEPPADRNRTIPSWLFEDLETDLSTHNPARQDDPIDQFQEAKPVTRPSALERLLSEEPAADPDTTGEEEPPRRPGPRSSPRNNG